MQKPVKMSLKGKLKEIGNGQNNSDFEKETDPKGYSDPDLGLYTYMYMNIIVIQIL